MNKRTASIAALTALAVPGLAQAASGSTVHNCGGLKGFPLVQAYPITIYSPAKIFNRNACSFANRFVGRVQTLLIRQGPPFPSTVRFTQNNHSSVWYVTAGDHPPNRNIGQPNPYTSIVARHGSTTIRYFFNQG